MRGPTLPYITAHYITLRERWLVRLQVGEDEVENSGRELKLLRRWSEFGWILGCRSDRNSFRAGEREAALARRPDSRRRARPVLCVA